MLAAATASAAKVTSAIVEDGAHRVLLDGQVGTGRSLALAVAGQALAEAGRPSILVQPPERDVDTAACALLDIAVGLARSGLLSPAEIRWTGRAGWNQRVDDVRLWLKGANDDGPVLLVDDISQWAIPEDAIAAEKVEAVRDVLDDANLPMVLVGTNDHTSERIEVAVNRGDELLSHPDDWGALWPVIEELRRSLSELSSAPPAEIALVVAAAALTSVDEVRRWWRASMTAEQVGDMLASHVSSDRRRGRLWNAWVIASLLREPIPASWLDDELRRVTSDLERAVLDRCLFVEHAGLLQVTREARAAARRQPDDRLSATSRDRGAANLQARYQEVMNADLAEGSVRALRRAGEVLYLGARNGDVDSAQVAPVAFADQVAAIGVSAQSRSDWGAAVAAFERALEVDPNDAAIRHQLGFSLDNVALEPRRVEEEYVRSIQLSSGHASWHARLISFLLVRARTSDALDRWSRSCSDLSSNSGAGPIALYEKLHLPVAAMALRRSELAFGYTVLDDVPTWAREQLIGYRAHRHRLETLELSQATGSFVPAERAGPGWWKQGPALLSERFNEGEHLQRWLACGVEFTSDREVGLTVAVVDNQGSPQTGTLSIQMDDLLHHTLDESRAVDLEPGDFLEIGYYGVGAEVGGAPVIRVLPRTEWLDGIETPLDPARYIARATW